MQVIYIRPARSKGYVRIGISDEESKYDFTVSEADYRLGDSPLVSDNLTRDSFLILHRSDEFYRARLKAMRVLEYGDNSERMLKMKLARAGFSAGVTDEVVREMVSLGYVNARRQLEKLITYEINTKFTGKAKLYPKLMAKGYSRSDIEIVIDELLYRGEVDLEVSKKRLIESKLGEDATDEEIRALLYKHGYHND